MERDLQSLLDMLQSAEIVMDYISGRSRPDLTTDLQLQDAIIRRLLMIGEAAKRVSEPTRNRLTTIPWSVINGMRNRLVHEYDAIDLDVVWDTAVKSLPRLIVELKKVIPSG
ncbi:HepT-like ribonuclease domain-containing protein [Laspinema palackyanum]|uniref:HepT-like ribonuclease domain-containing protein n=1 Tax=Laspinema palackyanum TaxID=3231601 RepID=UPI00345CFA21|nr:DUF86 domain-containing protein [Laspinema sp. D2c]